MAFTDNISETKIVDRAQELYKDTLIKNVRKNKGSVISEAFSPSELASIIHTLISDGKLDGYLGSTANKLLERNNFLKGTLPVVDSSIKSPDTAPLKTNTSITRKFKSKSSKTKNPNASTPVSVPANNDAPSANNKTVGLIKKCNSEVATNYADSDSFEELSKLYFQYCGNYYAKKDVRGKSFNFPDDFPNISLAGCEYHIDGVGPKKLKATLVGEPKDVTSGLHTAWKNKDPMFISIGYIAPYLQK